MYEEGEGMKEKSRTRKSQIRNENEVTVFKNNDIIEEELVWQ